MWAVLPIKRLHAAKSRLHAMLTREQCASLVCAMAGDVLDALHAEPRIEQVSVVSDDPRVGALAEARGARWWTEHELAAGQGLNGAVAGAAARLRQHACEAMLVVHGDLPLLDAETIGRFIDAWFTLPPHGIAIAPSHDGGTSLLLLDPRMRFAFSYGAGSLQRHTAQARHLGRTLAHVAAERALHDIDSPADLARLFREPRRRHDAATTRALDALPTGLRRKLAVANLQKVSCHD